VALGNYFKWNMDHRVEDKMQIDEHTVDCQSRCRSMNDTPMCVLALHAKENAHENGHQVMNVLHGI